MAGAFTRFLLTLVSRTRCSAKRCVADAGPSKTPAFAMVAALQRITACCAALGTQVSHTHGQRCALSPPPPALRAATSRLQGEVGGASMWPSARWAHALAAIALLLFTSSIAPARAAPVKGEVTATVANGFARLVFNLADEVDADVRAANGIVVIAFRRPVDVAVEQLPAALSGYVSVARRDPDGNAVRLALMRKVTVNTMAAGERIYVDLLPSGWTGLPPGLPQEVVEELARRARDAEKRLKQQQKSSQRQFAQVRVRVASLPTFTRYVFELPELIGAAIDRGKDRLSVAFEAPLRFDLAEAKAALPATVASIDADVGDETVSVRFGFHGKVDVRTFREDNAFVVDVSRAAVQDEVAAPESLLGQPKDPAAERPAGAPGAEHKADTSKVAPPVGDTEPQSPPSASSQASGSPSRPPLASFDISPASQPQSAKAASAHAAPKAAEPPPERAEVAAPAAPASADPNAPVTAHLKRQGDTLRLTFPFRSSTPAAVFRRADTLWLVFDSAVAIDVARLKDDLSRTIRDIDMVRSGEGQVIRLKLERPRLASFAADGDGWVVTLGDMVLEPTLPLTIARTGTAAEQAIATIAFDDPREVHRLSDPDVGDKLLVVTALGPARGLLKPQDFVEFRALASVHGVVIQPLADDVVAERAPERIAIARPGGLMLTAADGSAAAAAATSYRPVALDPQAWGFDRKANFVDRQAELMHAAADAPDGKRGPARLAVARFYVAREMYPEAKAVLDVTLSTEREFGDLATALVLRAIANIMMGRSEPALKDLGNGAVGNHHDAPVWRALAYAGQRRWAEAHEGLRNAEAVTAEYPVELQRVALVEAVRSAIEVGDFSEAARRLNEFDGIGIPRELKATLSLLSGRLAEGLGRPGDALAAYRGAAESIDQPAAAQGRLREVALRHTVKTVTRAEATAELEILTAGWRGDDTENEALLLLSRFYTEDARYRDALQVMRVCLLAHARSDFTRRIQDEAAATFDSLFLGERAETLPPIDALGLFYDFRILTPVGRRGDEMIRRLAERLITMDLLAQASELLQHQVEHRLHGAARAHVATRLATIYLMNRKPDRALNMLRASRVAELPNDLRNQRLLIEARALSDTGRHDVALEVAANLEGREVERLRADIHWAARRWRQAAEQIERIYGERWRDFAPLNESERADILRGAIAYALSEDGLGVDRFRQKYAAKMAEGPERRMFDVVTARATARTEELGEIAKAASLVDTLSAFLRDLRARYPDAGASASAAPPARGS
jgi:hypothetical protein